MSPEKGKGNAIEKRARRTLGGTRCSSGGRCGHRPRPRDRWRRRLDVAIGEIRGGAGLVSALARQGLLHRRHDVPLLFAGETAGRLVQALDHRVGQLCKERDFRMEVVAEWLPRGVYFLILLHMVRGFL